MFEFEIIKFEEIDLNEYYYFEKKSIFTTIEWINYLETEYKEKITIIKIEKENKLIGYLTGMIIKKYGVKIFASPFKGWTTCYMGFDLIDYSLSIDIIPEVSQFIIKELKCIYIEIVDKNISLEEAQKLNCKISPVATLELDIDKSDEELFKVFKTDCRNYIRQFERRGAIIKQVKPDQNFIAHYYDQLIEVFQKQGLVPTYSKNKVINLLSALSESDLLLCQEVYNPEGKSIATSVFYAFNQYAYFWGAASYREFQSYRPNEYMIWSAIKYFREKGIKKLDMVGLRPYKLKFGPNKVEYPRIMISKYKILFFLRDLALKLYYQILKIKGLKLKLSKKV